MARRMAQSADRHTTRASKPRPAPSPGCRRGTRHLSAQWSIRWRRRWGLQTRLDPALYLSLPPSNGVVNIPESDILGQALSEEWIELVVSPTCCPDSQNPSAGRRLFGCDRCDGGDCGSGGWCGPRSGGRRRSPSARSCGCFSRRAGGWRGWGFGGCGRRRGCLRRDRGWFHGCGFVVAPARRQKQHEKKGYNP